MSSYAHAHHSHRCDTSLIPISTGASVPRDYDAPIYNRAPRKSCYEKENLPCDEVTDAIEKDDPAEEDRSWVGQREMHRRSYDWYHSNDRTAGEGENTFRRGKIMPNPSTYIEDPYYSGMSIGGYYVAHGLRDDLDRDSAHESDDENDSRRYSDSCREESDEEEEEEWYDDATLSASDSEDESEGEDLMTLPPAIISYGEDIESIYMPRLLHYTQLPNSLCEVIGSYMDPDADLGLLLDDVCTMALRCIDQIGQYRTDAMKLGEYLPQPKAKVLAEELPPKAAEALQEILANRNVGHTTASSTSLPPTTSAKTEQMECKENGFDESSSDEDDDTAQSRHVRQGTLDMYPLRMYLCSRSRRALNELEKIVGCELDGSISQTLTCKIMNRVKNRSLPPLSRMRLEMMIRLFTREFDAWDQLMSEMESRLDTADEEWRFASNLLMVSDYILTSRPTSSQIQPKRPFRVGAMGRGNGRKYELKPATKRDDVKLNELLSFPDLGAKSTAAELVIPSISVTSPSSSLSSALVVAPDEEKKQSDTVPPPAVDTDTEMKVDDGADADDEGEDDVDDDLTVHISAYTISPISGSEQESSAILGSTLADATQRLASELLQVDPTPIVSPRLLAVLQDMNLVYRRCTPDQDVPQSEFIQDLMKESITAQSYRHIIAAYDGALDPRKQEQYVLPPGDTLLNRNSSGGDTIISNIDVDRVDRNLLALSTLNRLLLLDFGDTQSKLAKFVDWIDRIQVSQAMATLKQAWKFIHRSFPAATKDKLTEKIDLNDESELDEGGGIEKPLPPIVTLMNELCAIIREPTYTYHAHPPQQMKEEQQVNTTSVAPLSPSTSPSASSNVVHSMIDATDHATMNSDFDSASVPPTKKRKTNDGAAHDISSLTDAAAPMADDSSSFLYTGEYTIHRRVMTPQKHEAALILTSQLDRLRLFMSRHTADYSHLTNLTQLRHLIESARIAMAHYYLLHMTRSASLDTEISALNAHFSQREESHHADHVFTRSNFHQFVREVGQDCANDLLFTNLAVQILQEVSEQELVRHFELVAQTLNSSSTQLSPPTAAASYDLSSFSSSSSSSFRRQSVPRVESVGHDSSLLPDRDISVSDFQRITRLLPLKRLSNL